MSSENIRIIVLIISILLSNGFSLFFYLKNKRSSKEGKINDNLFKLQGIALEYPYLEDKRFISGWEYFREKYSKVNQIDFDADKKYLQYEQYCEMLFNFMSDSFYYYKQKETKLLKEIDFKSWAKKHQSWWHKPLVDNSNYETYEKSFSKMIDSWIEEKT
ncbi:hypothetical protein GCM10023211_01870 [Orbus sasakiae]|uniref:Uncharacterized protein n=1 Tax=Orbus sasakiae TaxID=1078475 RepID=A0ABP9N0S5_9GAMM